MNLVALVRAAQLQACELLVTPGLAGSAARGATVGPGSGRNAPVHDNSRAPPGARRQHAMADEQIGLWPRRHRCQAFQELQGIEHQLPRAVVPGRLQLERDTAVAPQPQPLLREARMQDISA